MNSLFKFATGTTRLIQRSILSLWLVTGRILFFLRVLCVPLRLIKSSTNAPGRFARYQHPRSEEKRGKVPFPKNCKGWDIVCPTPKIGLALANTASHSRFESDPVKNDPTQLVGLSNAFELLQDDWIQLSPLGDFPHLAGIQRIDKKATDAMANSFNSFFAKLGRRFTGVPFYIGHPDVPGIANEYPDKKAYGWVEKLESRVDGLYGKVKWSDPGQALLANAHYKFFSPYWDAAEVGFEKGRKVFSPQTLLSVGLTNSPNIPVLPLANEEPTKKPTEIMNPKTLAALVALLSMANTATPEQVEARILELQTSGTSLTGLQNETSTTATALANEQNAHTATRGKVTEAETKFANERKARRTLLLDNAIEHGRITGAQRPEWETKLANDATFETEAANLSRLAPAIKTTPITGNLGNRKAELANVQERSVKVRELVQAKEASGLSYDAAFAAVQRENSALFSQMQQPGS